MRILLRIAYDGTGYSGWQYQPNAVTIEEKLLKALEELFGKKTDVIGASRTDAGVHALGNVAVFDTDSRIPPEKISYALNVRLPEAIRVVESRQVPDNFHPRHCDCTKTYEYRIWNAPFENPIQRLHTEFVYGTLDLTSMREAASYLVGEHDFTSFCSIGTHVVDKVRTVYSLEVLQNGELVTIRIRGNGFLYNMVRIIAGTLLKVGQKAIEPQAMRAMIESMDRQKAGPTAPARGLTLIKIDYGDII